MSQMPTRQEQIVTAHAGLIVKVVKTIQNSDLLPDLQEVLRVSEENGWTDLVAAIRKILGGERELAPLIVNLDEEDSVIVEAILQGIQHPAGAPGQVERGVKRGVHRGGARQPVPNRSS